MRDTLVPGIRHRFVFRVPADKTVPALYPESAEFQQMPEVFATGFLVGLVEWTCIQAVNPHLDWPREQTVGTRVDLTHEAPTPPGCEVCVEVELLQVEGRRLVFRALARDDAAIVAQGTHERAVIDRERFAARLASARPGVRPEPRVAPGARRRRRAARGVDARVLRGAGLSLRLAAPRRGDPRASSSIPHSAASGGSRTPARRPATSR